MTNANRALVLAASAATIDRMLSNVRISARFLILQSVVRCQSEILPIGDWGDPPGFHEADRVAHGRDLSQRLIHPDLDYRGYRHSLDRMPQQNAFVESFMGRCVMSA
jgi:hypothetical protein